VPRIRSGVVAPPGAGSGGAIGGDEMGAERMEMEMRRWLIWMICDGEVFTSPMIFYGSHSSYTNYCVAQDNFWEMQIV
jgi:hypothetical protein